MMYPLPPAPEMRRAVQKRDAAYDGLFYFGVRTTGIFCRPSCSARRPLPRNVEFFANVNDATSAGYRPCKRCRPLAADGTPPAWVVRLLKRVEKDPAARVRDSELRTAGIDPARARRYFLQHHGMTFHAYCRRRRMGQALESIRMGTPLNDVALGHGYESHSGFREAFAKTFGRAPGKSRDTDCIHVTWIESPLGPLLAAANDQGLCLLEYSEPRTLQAQLNALRRHFDCAIVPGEHPHLQKLKDELARYFAGTLQAFSLPLVYPGTPFQQKVWGELLKIPYGETRSYEDIARAAKSPRAVRAVGTTNGANRICILIPCHRVVNKGGKLGGYGGGVWRKQALLELEQRSQPQHKERLGACRIIGSNCA